jgi:hypothetical protein
MNCNQIRKQLRDSGAQEMPAEALMHMDGCAGCAALFQRQRRLEADLEQMAAAQAGWSAPPRVEAALLEQFRSQIEQPGSTARVPRIPLLVRFRVPALAAAGALAAALALILISRTPHPSHMVATSISQASEIDDESALDSGFVPLPYFGNSGDLLANAAEADVVRVEMPRSTLVTLGVPVNDDGNSGTVQAELLLGEGGVPQAVRVLE